ncbi:MAG: serine--tRNA ligase [Candidatus Brocadiae bacterium]|nr:serine--tRNA ligase [Candidatus Brocadiia bacterium]
MLDIQLIRSHPDRVRGAIAAKKAKADVDAVLAADEKWRHATTEAQKLQAESNAANRDMGRLMKENRAEGEKLKVRLKELSDRRKALEDEAKALEGERDRLVLDLPNIPQDDVPVGPEETHNRVVKEGGAKPAFGFKPQAHWDLGPKLGVVDFDRAAKISGSGFVLFTGLGARLQRALVAWFIDVHTREHGYTEVYPPVLVLRDTMVGTGQLPKFEEEMYKLKDDPLYLIPTAEVPVTNIYRDEILPAEKLPLLHCAFSLCFRREAGAAGKDTRGMIRVHQFDKVEMVKWTRPEESEAEHEKLTANAEVLLNRLGLPWRRVLIATAGMGFSNQKQYDLEVHAAGVDRWIEVSSCSNFGEFQARRAGIRFRDTDGKLRYVHTLNGSGLALPRIVVGILENFQQADGSVVIPEVLRPYMGVDRLTAV